MSANVALMRGASGFFTARPLSPWLQPSGTLEATSFYDTRELKRTLERLVDFDRLNAGLSRRVLRHNFSASNPFLEERSNV
jgi:NTE family protein